VRATLSEMKRDLGVWAEADALANDDVTLRAADLVDYLIVFRGIPAEIVTLALIRESMAIYRRHLDLAPRGTGKYRRAAFCKRGHGRTPDNVDKSGTCIKCRDSRKAARK